MNKTPKKCRSDIDRFYAMKEHRGIATGAELANLLGCSEGYVREFGRTEDGIRRVGSTLIYDRDDAIKLLDQLEGDDEPSEAFDEETEIVLLRAGLRDLIEDLGDFRMPGPRVIRDAESAQALLGEATERLKGLKHKHKNDLRQLATSITRHMKEAGELEIRRGNSPDRKTLRVHPMKYAGEKLVKLSTDVLKEPMIQHYLR